MVHQRQRPALPFKTGNDGFRAHARLDHFQCHFPAQRRLLQRQIHGPHAAFAKLAQDFIGSNRINQRLVRRQKILGPFVVGQQQGYFRPQRFVAVACLRQVRIPRARRKLQRRVEQFADPLIAFRAHAAGLNC